jgi:hypothetical protein
VRKLAPKDESKRYGQINAFENAGRKRHQDLKFMLHIQKEQRERLQARLDEPRSRWKFNPSDLEDRKFWDKFMAAYELALDKCSTVGRRGTSSRPTANGAQRRHRRDRARDTPGDEPAQYPKSDWDPKSFVIK